MSAHANKASSVHELFDLSGRVFLVVGGARHLGYEMAQGLAEAGAVGAITSRHSGAAADAALRLQRDTGREIVGMPLEAGDEAQVRVAVAATVARFGQIDVLVNNVGGGALGRPDEQVDLENRELADWERLLRLNVTAPWLVAKYVAPVMRGARRGSIINIASIAGMIGRDRSVYPAGMPPQTLDYAAAKGGLTSLTRDLAAYLGRDGIRVNSVSPGGIERGQPAAFVTAYSQKTMLGRMGRPGDLKGAVVFLAADASAYVTGQNLVVDGGFSTWQ